MEIFWKTEQELSYPLDHFIKNIQKFLCLYNTVGLFSVAHENESKVSFSVHNAVSEQIHIRIAIFSSVHTKNLKFLDRFVFACLHNCSCVFEKQWYKIAPSSYTSSERFVFIRF